MSTYRVTFEIALKDDSIKHNDFIYEIVKQSLEKGEQLTQYEIKELKQ